MGKATAQRKKRKTVKKSDEELVYGIPVSEFRLLQRKKEPLLPELKPYLQESFKDGLLAISHPLVIDAFVAPGYFAVVNHRYKLVKELVSEAKESRNWVKYFALIGPPYRLDKLKGVLNELTDGEYWKLLGQMYILTEIVSFQQKTVRDLFSSSRPEREKLMDADEQKILDALPDELTIYRGYDLTNSKGWSWTLSEEKAEWFANRWREASPERRRNVATGRVRKKDVIAYFDGRNEKEIIANPQKVKVVSSRRLD